MYFRKHLTIVYKLKIHFTIKPYIEVSDFRTSVISVFGPGTFDFTMTPIELFPKLTVIRQHQWKETLPGFTTDEEWEYMSQ